MVHLSDDAIKRSHLDLSKRSLNGILLYPLAWLILTNFTSILNYQNFIVYLSGFVILIVSALRLALVKYFDVINIKYPEKWIQLFSLGVITSAVIWSLFSVLCLSYLGLTPEVVIIILPIIVFSAGGIVSLSPDRNLLISFLAILTIPQILIFIQLGTTNSYVISFIFLIFEIYLLKVGLQINKDYWTLIIRSEDNYRLFENVVEHSVEAILITDENNKIIFINSAMQKDTGYTLEDLKGKDPSILRSNYTPNETYPYMWQAIKEKDHWQGELWDKTKSGEIVPKWASIYILRDADSEITNYIANFTDLTERKEAEQRIEHLAHHDALTGLLNRSTLEQRLEQAISMSKRNRKKVAVMFIDMDRFKLINDTKGHDVGDALLIEVAKRLKKSTRQSDIVARQGGDEFVVVLTDMEDVLISSAIATYIVHSLGQPYELNAHTLHTSPSIGISTFPSDGNDATILLKNADTAMYHAKDDGRNNFKFFSKKMNKSIADKLEMESDLRDALSEKQFSLYYQPKINTANETIAGFEALIRWHHPEKGLISPDRFIPVSEELRLINDLGDWVIEEAVKQQKIWFDQGYTELVMAINLSLQQFLSEKFIENVGTIIHKNQLNPKNIEFEITESIAMHDPEMVISKLKELNDIGVSLAIDDFGTGYSSLAYLKRLPVQTIKIDKTFISNLEHDESDKKITSATISLAHTLGFKVVAEGVENKIQMKFLQDLNCEYLQGYLYSKPLPIDEANKLLNQELMKN
ncbi:MAG: EAL domain-containing protein [Gammaproteobacteria bacterium]|nr:EAL domain-containing protein [Gammaproteobacteria bacterium]